MKLLKTISFTKSQKVSNLSKDRKQLSCNLKKPKKSKNNKLMMNLDHPHHLNQSSMKKMEKKFPANNKENRSKLKKIKKKCKN
jgi:hypothetical protein